MCSGDFAVQHGKNRSVPAAAARATGLPARISAIPGFMLDTKNSSVPQTDSASKALRSKGPIPAAIPVSVTGSRATEPAGQRELFAETTETVLLLSNGAVVRLSAAATPGQLLFLSNKKTGREVVCRVVKYKSSPSGGGYAELEFTEAAPGFWDGELPAGASRPRFPTSAEGFKAASDLGGTKPDVAAQGERPPDAAVPGLVGEAPANSSAAADARDEEASQQLLDEPHAAPPAGEGGAEIAFLQQQLESLLSGKTPASLSSRTERHLPAPDTSAVANALLKILDAAKATSPTGGEVAAEAAITVPAAGISVANTLFADSGASAAPETELDPNRLNPVSPGQELPSQRTSKLPPRPHYAPPTRPSAANKILRIGALAAGIMAAAGIAWHSRRAKTPPVDGTSTPARAATKSNQRAARSIPPRQISRPDGSAPPLEHIEAVKPRASLTTGADPETKDLDAEAAAELRRLKEAGSKNPEVSHATPAQSEAAERNLPASDPEAGDVQPAKVLKSVRAVAPPEATREYISGNVAIDAVVDETGHVTKMKVLSGPEVLRKAAMKALKEWQYQPATINGKPTPSHVIEKIQFWYEP